MEKFFHVESKRRDGSWGTFTEYPLEGAEKANEHLTMVQDHMRKHGLDPADVRLHELTVEEQADEVVRMLTTEEKLRVLRDHVLAQPDFWDRVRAARSARQHKKLIDVIEEEALYKDRTA